MPAPEAAGQGGDPQGADHGTGKQAAGTSGGGQQGSSQSPASTGAPEPTRAASAADIATSGALARDPVDAICPYLVFGDGSYPSTEPDEGHRCAAQDPPGTLPMAFQERYCLTERHVRCEMYKYAQESAPAPDTAAETASGVVASGGGSGRRSRTSHRAGSSQPGSPSGSNRPMLLALGGIVALVLAIVIVVLLLGGGHGSGLGPDTTASPGTSSVPQTTRPPAATPTPPADATAPPTRSPEGSPSGVDPSASPDDLADRILVRYEVQEDEALLAIAAAFRTTRRAIIRANEGMVDAEPYVEPGVEILVPASADMTIEELEAVPGYLGLAE